MFVKVNHNGKIIKVKSDGLTLAQLKATIREKCEIPANRNFNLAYTDADGDVITVVSDEDLKVGIDESLEHSKGQANAVPTLSLLVVEEGVSPVINPVVSGETNVVGNILPATVTQSVEVKQSQERVVGSINTPEAMKVEPIPTQPAGGVNYPTNQPQQAQTNPSITVQNTGLFQGATANAQPNPAPSNLFSNATPSNTGSGLFSNANAGVTTTIFTTPPVFPASCCPPIWSKPVVQHYGITCDSCKCHPIVGVRYKSVTRYNFDLCSGCYKKPQYSNELFLAVPNTNYNHLVNGSGFNTVINYFKGSVPTYPIFPVYPCHIRPPGRQRHRLFTQLKAAFPNDTEDTIDGFLWSYDGQTYESVYPLYIQQYHSTR